MENLSHHLQPRPSIEQKNLDYYADILDNIVNTGLNIIHYDNASKDFIDNAPRKMLLRHFLELIDATSILIKKASVLPAHHTLRNALEGFLLLKFLLFNDSREKSKAYIVANMMDYKDITYRLKQNGRKNFSDTGIDKTVDDMIEYYEATMNSAEYHKIYEQLKQVKGQQKNWYKIFSVNTIKDIAKEIDEAVWYDRVYSSLSARTHGGDTIAGNMTNTVDGEAYIKNIRQTGQAQTVTSIATTIAIHCYDYYIQKNVPQFLTEYNMWRNDIVNKNRLL